MPVFRAISVASVSSGPQATEEKYSIPDQLDTNRRWAATNDTEIVAEIIIPGHSRYYTFLDEIVLDCPEYAEILRWIRSGEINLLLCAYYPRLYRTMELEQALMAVCRANGVQVYSPAEGGNLQPPDRVKITAMDKLHGSLQGFRAESEIESLIQRHDTGMKGRIRAGLHASNNSVPYGYRPTPGHRQVVEINEGEARWVRWIFERRADGWGHQAIQRELTRLGVPAPKGGKNWHYNTVRRMVRNPFYIGTVTYGTAVNANGLHERLISDELWGRVQRINESRADWAPDRGIVYPLSGLVRCGHCGAGMYYNGPHARQPTAMVRCARYSRYGRGACVFNSYPADDLARQVFALAQQIAHDPRVYWEQSRNGHLAELASERDMLDAQIADMGLRYERLIDLVERGMLDAAKFAERAARLDPGALQARRNELASRIDIADAAETRLASLAAVAERMAEMTVAELRTLYASIITKVLIYRDRSPRIILY